jgi:plasmid stabilization system protein ParE
VRLRVRKLARAEINAAFVWYLLRSSRAAADFLDAVDGAIKSIERAPKRQPIIRGQLRRLLLKGFPYGVYYKVFPRVISVVGVIHGRRHPEAWLRRA